MVSEAVRRGDVFLVALNPTRGREMRKTRPCVVVSPDEYRETRSIRSTGTNNFALSA